MMLVTPHCTMYIVYLGFCLACLFFQRSLQVRPVRQRSPSQRRTAGICWCVMMWWILSYCADYRCVDSRVPHRSHAPGDGDHQEQRRMPGPQKQRHRPPRQNQRSGQPGSSPCLVERNGKTVFSTLCTVHCQVSGLRCVPTAYRPRMVWTFLERMSSVGWTSH